VDAAEEYRLFAPASLVESDGDRHSVWVVDPVEQVARRKVVGLGAGRSSTLVVIASGLDASSRLIASGREGLEEGMRVEVQGEAAAAGETLAAPAHDREAMSRHPM
jgi:hypothetical protein